MTTTAGATPPPPAEPPRWLTVPEIATELRVAPMTVYRWCHRGDLPSVRVGRSYRIRSDVYDQFIADSQTRPAAPEDPAP